MKVKLKQPVFDAVQWHQLGDHGKVTAMPRSPGIGWLWNSRGGEAVHPGNWVLTNEAGDHCVVTDHVFKRMYQEAEQ